MGMGRYVVEAVLLEGRSVTEVARAHGISRYWLYQLIARYRDGGADALEPRSRRPRSCAHAVDADVQASICRLRHDLAAAGHDSGPQTIAHHLRLELGTAPSIATIWRVLQRHGLITPQPHKRPRSSFIRFEAQLPNELWQADTTHWQLADASDVEILNCLDDHSRYLLICAAYTTVKAADVTSSLAAAWLIYGYPQALLTDNGAIFSAKPRKGKVLLESELERLGIKGKHSTPYHPQTCGKVERFHQTLKRFLSKQQPPRSLAVLQAQSDAFRTYYNQQRPHRALHGNTPFHAFNARIKAAPLGAATSPHYRVRHDRVDKTGRVTLRYLSRLYHIGLGAEWRQRRVTLLVDNKDIRVLTEDGELIRALTLDPSRDYQPLGRPPGPQPKPKLVNDVVRHASSMS
jgi:transposase InsO family protein